MTKQACKMNGMCKRENMATLTTQFNVNGLVRQEFVAVVYTNLFFKASIQKTQLTAIIG